MRRASRRRPDEIGFTLIELLVVVIIIGILAGIAIPVFMNQKAKASEATLRADLSNGAKVIETYFADEGSWAALRSLTGATDSIRLLGPPDVRSWNDYPTLPRAKGSSGNVITVAFQSTVVTGSWPKPTAEGEICLTATNVATKYHYPGGNASRYDEILYYDSQAGGIVTVWDLVDRVDTGQPVACAGYARLFKYNRGL